MLTLARAVTLAILEAARGSNLPGRFALTLRRSINYMFRFVNLSLLHVFPGYMATGNWNILADIPVFL